METSHSARARYSLPKLNAPPRREAAELARREAEEERAVMPPASKKEPEREDLVMVTVSTPERRPVTTYIEYTGTTQASERVDLRARVKGLLESIHFKPDTDVKQGDLLFVVDSKPFQAKVDQAAADLTSKEVLLVSAESEFKRCSRLYAVNATL